MGKRNRPNPSKTATIEKAKAPAWTERLSEVLGSKSLWIAGIAVVIATLRIALTYPIFNHTIDEPAHIACGMEWLSRGTYRMEPQHPPLTRVFAALGPFLAGERTEGRRGMYNEGAAILYHNGNYMRNLTLARLGTLPFFWLGCVVVYFAAARWYGRAQAAIAVILFTLLPPILAHAGLATTDMGLTATLGLAMFMLVVWAENPAPGIGLGAAMGFSVALTILSKYSSLAFLPACVGLMLAWAVLSRRSFAPIRRMLTLRHGLSLVVALVICAAVVWAGFRFSIRDGMPAPELFAGIQQASHHQDQGHPSYLLGARSLSGFWLFYPVALGVKTPLGFLVLLAGGLALAWQRRKDFAWWLPVAGIAGILAVGLYSRINIGTRHVLPIYFFFVLLTAACVWEWLGRAPQKSWMGWAVVVLGGWMAFSGVWNHPDYLAYFNELAGDEPERILADSDLDWGQDMLRLAARLHEVGATSVTFNPLIVAFLHDYHGFPPLEQTDPGSPLPGWNAISITVWKVARLGLMEEHKEVQLWPDIVKRQERVGRGVLLYYFDPSQLSAPKPAGG